MKILKVLFAAAFSLVLIGCSATSKPIQEPSYTVTGLSAKQVEKAILDADKADRGWVLKKVKNGVISGKLVNREYMAEVEIPYSASGYTIKYVSSSANLKSDGKNIHRIYNRWVVTLDSDIKKQLIRQ